MILNAWAITAAFLAATAGVVALAATITALVGVRTTRESAGAGPLFVLLGAILLGLRIAAVPLHFAVLKSYVPALADRGVMCSYGASQVRPELVRAVEALGAAALLALGAWLVRSSALVAAGRGEESARRGDTRQRAPWFALAAAVAVAASAAELVHLFADKGARPVSCCSVHTGTAAALGGARLEASLLGAPAVFAATHALLLVALLRAARRGAGAAEAAGVAGLASFAAVVAFGFSRDTLAPRVLGLPYHRCAHELLTDTLALGPAALLFGAGIVAAVLAPLASGAALITARLHTFAALATASALLVVAIHFV